MKSLRHGRSISRVEIQGVSNHGIWLYAAGAEYFLSYESYPWFRDATIGQIYNVEFLFGAHLRWPDLDIDLELEALKHPENYPLVYQGRFLRNSKLCVNEKKHTKYGKKK
jgi:hypothetical protein